MHPPQEAALRSAVPMGVLLVVALEGPTGQASQVTAQIIVTAKVGFAAN
jgi:hypothetical protein